MTVWWCAIHRSEGYATYEELKARNVIAQGWPSLGDLSGLVGLPEEFIRQHFTSRQADGEIGVFVNLIGKIQVGDLVVGIEGRQVWGICQVLEETAYLYDSHDNLEGVQHPYLAANSKDQVDQFSEFNYAHCLYPIYWVDWNTVSPGWDPSTPGQGVKGIVRLNNDASAVNDLWQKYKDTLGRNLPWMGTWLTERLQRRNKLYRSAAMKELDEIFSVLKQVILYGPPGTGKTYEAIQIASHLLGFAAQDSRFRGAQFSISNSNGDTGKWDIVQFHPSYNYEDFVRGIQSVPTAAGVNYAAVNKIFADMCVEAATNEQPYILIIDEINRANLSAVLGELLYGLEYRGTAVRTPYTVKNEPTLIVPKNLYIIGTMNTADRSIGHLDYAVRRRFAFRQCRADRIAVQRYYDAGLTKGAGESSTRDQALEMFDEVSKLFRSGSQDSVLSPEYRPEDVQVGHTYFMAETHQHLSTKFRYQVLPLLHEYLADGVFLPGAEPAINRLGRLDRRMIP